MAKSRKTVDVERLRQYANGYLASDFLGGDSSDAIARRDGVCAFIETVLMAADRYRGFRYLDERDLQKSKPGIRVTQGNQPTFFNTDSTRREYY